MSHSRDPLDYLIGDEPIPEELRADEEFTRAYAEAEADLGVIRRGLTAYAEQTPSTPAEATAQRKRPRWAGWTIGIAAVAACAVVIVGLGGWVLNDMFQSAMQKATGAAGDSAPEAAKRGDDDTAGRQTEPTQPGPSAPADPSDPPGSTGPGSAEGGRAERVGCGDRVARGHVWTRTPLGKDRLRVEIKVTRQLLPAADPGTIYVEVDRSKEWRTGREVLIVVPKNGTEPSAIWPDTEPQRTAATEQRAGRAAADCPSR